MSRTRRKKAPQVSRRASVKTVVVETYNSIQPSESSSHFGRMLTSAWTTTLIFFEPNLRQKKKAGARLRVVHDEDRDELKNLLGWLLLFFFPFDGLAREVPDCVSGFRFGVVVGPNHLRQVRVGCQRTAFHKVSRPRPLRDHIPALDCVQAGHQI